MIELKDCKGSCALADIPKAEALVKWVVPMQEWLKKYEYLRRDDKKVMSISLTTHHPEPRQAALAVDISMEPLGIELIKEIFQRGLSSLHMLGVRLPDEPEGDGLGN